MPIRLSSLFVPGSRLRPAIATAACSGEAVQSHARVRARRRRPQSPAVPVNTAVVSEKSIPLSLGVIGTVEAYSTVSVRAQMTGELTSVRFKEGDDVRKGQVLFTLDRRPLEAALEQARANLQRDTAQAANAKAQAQRYQDLAARGIATKEQVDTTTTAAAALEATLGSDRAAVENATVQLQDATISAPIRAEPAR